MAECKDCVNNVTCVERRYFGGNQKNCKQFIDRNKYVMVVYCRECVYCKDNKTCFRKVKSGGRVDRVHANFYCAAGKRRAEDGSGEKPQTNADRIRAMSDEELADWVARTQIANVAEALSIAGIPWHQTDGIYDETKKECLDWLKQPAEVNDNA